MSPFGSALRLPTLLILLALAVLPKACAWVSEACSRRTPAITIKVDNAGHATRTLAGGRTYLLHVPPEYDGRTALPVVLSYHGAGGTSARQETLSQFADPGLRIAGLPVIAAYPQGADNAAENRTGVWYSAPYYNTTVDDVQFTKDILTDISTSFCIDLHRLYAAGKSNGGGFVAYLACRRDTSRVFAAFATVSPALYPQSLAFGGCDPDPLARINMLNSFGEQDQTIPYRGRNDSRAAGGAYGQGTATVNVPLWRREWAVMNGCATDQVQERDEVYTGTVRERWVCPRGSVEAYTTGYLGHSWPTTLGLDSSGAPNNTALFNLTSPAMATFFGRHYLKEWMGGW